MQSTQRADYKPFPEATLQVYQFCSQPRKKPTEPSYTTPPPKVSQLSKPLICQSFFIVYSFDHGWIKTVMNLKGKLESL